MATVEVAMIRLLTSDARKLAKIVPLEEVKICEYRLNERWLGIQLRGIFNRSAWEDRLAMTSHAKGARMASDTRSAAAWMKIR